jgi:hypothetical protein
MGFFGFHTEKHVFMKNEKVKKCLWSQIKWRKTTVNVY